MVFVMMGGVWCSGAMVGGMLEGITGWSEGLTHVTIGRR